MSQPKTSIAGIVAANFAGASLLREQSMQSLRSRALAIGASPEPSKPAPLGYTTDAGVATIQITGILTKYPDVFDSWLGFCPTLPIQAALHAAADDDAVHRICLLIDSPGGMVHGTTDLGNAVGQVNQIKPVDAVVSDMCASGALWIASQCGRIYANPSAEIGSIGVYVNLADSSKFWESIGVTYTTVSSGKFKGLGADGHVTPDLIADEKRTVDSLFKLFTAAISAGRKMPLEKVMALADGRTWIGEEARALGLVDEILPTRQALDEIHSAGKPASDSLTRYLTERWRSGAVNQAVFGHSLSNYITACRDAKPATPAAKETPMPKQTQNQFDPRSRPTAEEAAAEWDAHAFDRSLWLNRETFIRARTAMTRGQWEGPSRRRQRRGEQK